MAAVIRFKGEEYELSQEDILNAAALQTPQRIITYYVEVGGRRFPPKQLLRAATGTRKPFNSANARALLTKLGFLVRALP
jgi:5-methylcytosine-specific restriction protein B